MAYIIGQFNKPAGSSLDSGFMSQILNGSAVRKKFVSDLNVFNIDDENEIFANEGLQLTGAYFKTGISYYFHGQIKRSRYEQIFYVKLKDYGGDIQTSDQVDTHEQYIRTLKISPDTSAEHDSWVDVEFIFTPMKDFDTLVFELQRKPEDYRDKQRFPGIIYLEISEVKNILGSSTYIPAPQLVKLGVQGPSGLLMCINNEEIRIGKNGIYEIKNGLIYIDFFSVVGGLSSSSSSVNIQEAKLDIQKTLNGYEYQDELPKDQWITEDEIKGGNALYPAARMTSISFTKASTGRTRNLDSFSVDYMYKGEN